MHPYAKSHKPPLCVRNIRMVPKSKNHALQSVAIFIIAKPSDGLSDIGEGSIRYQRCGTFSLYEAYRLTGWTTPVIIVDTFLHRFTSRPPTQIDSIRTCTGCPPTSTRSRPTPSTE